MNRLAAIEVILLAAWLGASILTAAVVAPAAFRVLPSRTLAGALVGDVLPVIFVSGLAIAILMGLLEMRGDRHSLRLFAAVPLVAMIIGCSVAQFVIAPKIEAVRASIAGPVDSIAASDPRRVQFGRLHGLSVLWMGVAVLGAGSAIGRKLYITT